MSNIFEVFEITTINKDGKLNHKRKSVGEFKDTNELHAKISELQDDGKTFTVINAAAKVERIYRKERQNYRVKTLKYIAPVPAKKRTTPRAARVKKQRNSKEE